MKVGDFKKGLFISFFLHLALALVVMIRSVSTELFPSSEISTKILGEFSDGVPHAKKAQNKSLESVSLKNDLSVDGNQDFETIRSLIYSKKEYPKYSRIKSEEGTIVIGFKVNKEGFVSDRKILKPCAFAALNQAAFKIIQSIERVNFQSILSEEMNIEIPIQYSLK